MLVDWFIVSASTILANGKIRKRAKPTKARNVLLVTLQFILNSVMVNKPQWFRYSKFSWFMTAFCSRRWSRPVLIVMWNWKWMKDPDLWFMKRVMEYRDSRNFSGIGACLLLDENWKRTISTKWCFPPNSNWRRKNTLATELGEIAALYLQTNSLSIEPIGILAQKSLRCTYRQKSSRERELFMSTSDHHHPMTVNRGMQRRRNCENGFGAIKLRLLILLLIIQVVLCSQTSTMRPIERYPIFSRNGKIIKRGIQCRYQHQNMSIGIRGGAKESPVTPSNPTIFSSFRSFFHDNVLPKLKETRESMQQKVDDHIEGQAKRQQDQLDRNKRWRETAESTIPNDKLVGLSPSFSYASPKQRVQNTSLLPIEVLKLGAVACILAEVLDRAGIFDGDTTNTVIIRTKRCWKRLKLVGTEFWEDNALPVYKNLRYNLERWYHRHAKPRIFELQAETIRLEEWMQTYSQLHPRTTSRIKAILAICASYGITSTPLLFASVLRLWKPILLFVALSELNHCCKGNAESMGTILDRLLDRCRTLVWGTMYKILGKRRDDLYSKGYSSRGRWTRGRVDDRFPSKDGAFQMRRKLAKQGLYLVCSIGLVVIGLAWWDNPWLKTNDEQRVSVFCVNGIRLGIFPLKIGGFSKKMRFGKFDTSLKFSLENWWFLIDPGTVVATNALVVMSNFLRSGSVSKMSRITSIYIYRLDVRDGFR